MDFLSASDDKLVDVYGLDSSCAEWQWYWMDKGTWKPYSAHVNDLIENARKLGSSVAQFAIGGTYYELNLVTERQQNLSTRFIRTVKKVRPGETPEVPKFILPKEKKYRWYWMHQDWRAYPEHVNTMLETARRNGTSQVHFTSANRNGYASYSVNLHTMRQHNVQTQFSRVVKMMEVHPENPFIQWQFHGDKGWTSYDSDAKRKMEDDYQCYLVDRSLSSSTLTNARLGFTYRVDYITMTQTNLSTRK
jgi:hypothetical protein